MSEWVSLAGLVATKVYNRLERGAQVRTNMVRLWASAE